MHAIYLLAVVFAWRVHVGSNRTLHWLSRYFWCGFCTARVPNWKKSLKVGLHFFSGKKKVEFTVPISRVVLKLTFQVKLNSLRTICKLKWTVGNADGTGKREGERDWEMKRSCPEQPPLPARWTITVPFPAGSFEQFRSLDNTCGTSWWPDRCVDGKKSCPEHPMIYSASTIPHWCRISVFNQMILEI